MFALHLARIYASFLADGVSGLGLRQCAWLTGTFLIFSVDYSYE